MKRKQPSGPSIPDRARYGDDLLARIDELTPTDKLNDPDGNGWRNLLLACGLEIGRLREELRLIAFRAQMNENQRCSQTRKASK